jgi:integrase
MAYIRKLDSGLFQATVRLPTGKRVTRTDRLERVVAAWAREEEARVARGEWRDPKTMRRSFEDWLETWLAARVVERQTMQGDLYIIKNHIRPHWAGFRLAAVTRMEVQSWVRKMSKAGTGPATIRRAYNLMSSVMLAAVDEGILAETPCRRIDLPATPPKMPEWFTREQFDAIVAELPPRHAVAAELMVWCGLRWGEMAGLLVGDVDWLRQRVRVTGSAEQSGARKAYPKSAKSRRELPVPSDVLTMLAPLAEGRGPDARLFTSTRRPYPPWSGANWRKVWDDAVKAAGVPAYGPHALRHTAASWLVQEGVPIYDVQAFLGHENAQTTQRYAHLSPDAHGRVENAFGRLKTHQRRIASQDR